MTHFLRDILRQRTIKFLLGAGGPAFDAATAAIRSARHVYLTEIGSSCKRGAECWAAGKGEFFIIPSGPP